MAEVQLALQRGPAGFEKLVVVKLVHENLASQKPFVDMLLDEARIAALVKHPNVVDIYDLGEADGRYFIAMEYLEGEPLLAVLRAGRDGQRLDALSTARLIADTAEGLDAAHELRSMAGDPIELVHHDVSLGNIVVLYTGQVKLVDFGVAKASQSAAATTRIQGKFSYMAPEKLRGGPGDRRSDIWSLGCVLWEALTLRRLFKGGNDGDTMALVLDSEIVAPSRANGDVPADFDPIVLRALDRDPARRYATAKAMATELEDALRKHGYAAKNDQIAKYMQATFERHIAARKKLLQEVSSKGRASRDVLEAAFQPSALATGSMPRTRARASDSLPPLIRPPVLPDHTPSSEIASTRAVDAEAVLGAPLLVPSPPLAPARASLAVASSPFSRTSLAVASSPFARVEREPASPSPPDERTEIEPPLAPRPRWRLYGGGAVAVIAAVVVVSQLVGRGTAPSHASAGEPSSAVAEPVIPASEPALAPAVEPTAIAEPPHAEPAIAEPPHAEPPSPAPVAEADIAPRPRPAPPHHPPSPPRVAQATKPPVERPNPTEVFKAGLQAWVRGDIKTALASYKRALQASPDFAPAWRGVGLVYEKLGDKPSAHTAFHRYLQLSPNATDAPSIRARLESP
jgi:serine/threonine-protein kinase